MFAPSHCPDAGQARPICKRVPRGSGSAAKRRPGGPRGPESTPAPTSRRANLRRRRDTTVMPGNCPGTRRTDDAAAGRDAGPRRRGLRDQLSNYACPGRCLRRQNTARGLPERSTRTARARSGTRAATSGREAARRGWGRGRERSGTRPGDSGGELGSRLGGGRRPIAGICNIGLNL